MFSLRILFGRKARIENLDIKKAKAAIEADPVNVERHIDLANIWLKQKSLGEALAVLHSANKKIPGNPRLLIQLAGFSIWKRRYRRAASYAKQAIRIHPQEPLAYSTWALAYTLLGDHKKAAKILEEGIKICPEDCSLLFALAANFEVRGLPEIAVVQLRRMKRSDPDQESADVLIEQFYKQPESP